MIGWLQGQLAERWQQGSRCGALLVCHGVGYELQITRRQWDQLPAEGSAISLHVHQAIREDSWTLYGFALRQERDLFRELVSVSGVGPQMALGLLGCLAGEELVRAIVAADLKLLCQAPGVGKRTAERLSVELRGRLQERFSDLGTAALGGGEGERGGDAAGAARSGPSLAGDGQGLTPQQLRDELRLTLTALGYEPLEIHRALAAVAAQDPPDAADGEAWLRESLRWLSRQAA